MKQAFYRNFRDLFKNIVRWLAQGSVTSDSSEATYISELQKIELRRVHIHIQIQMKKGKRGQGATKIDERFNAVYTESD